MAESVGEAISSGSIDLNQLVHRAGSHEAAFDLLAIHIVETAVANGYIEDADSCRDAADLLTGISAKAEEAGDTDLNDLVGVAADLWSDRRTHETFSFGVEVIKIDGRYKIWRPR